MPFELSLKSFVWVQAAVLVLGFAFLLWRPKRQRGFLLKMGRGPSSRKGLEPSERESELNLASDREALEGRAGNTPVERDNFSGSPTRSKSSAPRALQVFFNYNGHTFEAYETFGLPAGTSFAKAEAAYRAQLEQVDAQSRPFLEAAFRALKASQN